MKQINMRDTFLPLQCKNMSHKQRKKNLESHLLLKENIYGTIKRITVAGGNKQIYFISKEYSI